MQQYARTEGRRQYLPLIRFTVAIFWGVLLYIAGVVSLAGWLAAIAIPQAYFAWWGPAHVAWGLALLQLVTMALPIAVLVAGGTLAALRGLGGGRLMAMGVCLGLLAGWVWESATGLLQLQAQVGGHIWPLLSASLRPRWWDLSVSLSPWLGWALAILSARRLMPIAAQPSLH